MRSIKKGSTDQSVILRALDSADGTPDTSIAYNSAGIDLWYRREGGAVVAITEATLSAADSAHSDGGVKHLDDGYFRLDLPDAAVASGANGVLVGGTADGMVIIGCYVHLVDYDPQDATSLGVSRIDAAITSRLAPTTAGRTLDADASGRVDVAKVAGTAQTARDLGAQLDATVSSRLAAASYTAPLDAAGTRSAVGLASADLDTQLAALPTAAEVRAEIDANSVGLAAIYARTDVATSTRLAGSSYVAPLDATATQSAAAAALTAYDPPTRTEATSDKDAILARLGTPANADLAADIAAVLTSIALRATPAQVATEIADALRADSGTELSSPPAKDAPVAAQVQWLFQALRNGGTQTATARTTRNDAGSTTGTQAVSDDGTTLVLGKAS